MTETSIAEQPENNLQSSLESFLENNIKANNHDGEERVRFGSTDATLKFTHMTTITRLDIVLESSRGSQQVTFSADIQRLKDKVIGNFGVMRSGLKADGGTTTIVGSANQMLGMENFPHEADLIKIMLQAFSNVYNLAISHAVICNPIRDQNRFQELVDDGYNSNDFDRLVKIYTPE